ncbi:MerR family transcriptional regulator [Levilactobacillus namurensis DSM 19117]|uniref:MerR family transcriptional regulator n=1 Tax=Levilactobacillus namurensis DSM 19117 TaxID=1423773 RepID=A0A0R1K3W4_9LACO|nr:MerR family transcriptional regulator [Levilactobacillus namurensis]KRK78253.1 MerR family transcriptional regulator [Levilactobacillus namurensis DSM 19117]GEO73572.1 transcriptional regulator [Levilactobacillus namurensis]
MYSIGDVAKMMNISTSALRFYDRQGLLPFVERNQAGRRTFKPNDLNFIEVIDCLKKSGVPVKNIASFIQLCMAGDGTLKERYDYLDHQEAVLTDKIQAMQAQLDFLRYKKWYYKTAVEAGTEAVHFLPQTHAVDPETKAQYQRARQNATDLHQLIDLPNQSTSQDQPD